MKAKPAVISGLKIGGVEHTTVPKVIIKKMVMIKTLYPQE